MDEAVKRRRWLHAAEGDQSSRDETGIPDNFVPSDRPYGFVSFFTEEVKRRKSDDAKLLITSTVRKDVGHVYKSLPSAKKQTYRPKAGTDVAGSSTMKKMSKLSNKPPFDTRCALDRLHILVKMLSEAQMGVIRELGFGSLLQIECGRLRRKVCAWLVEQYQPTDHSIFIHGKKLKLSVESFSAIMGIHDGGTTVTLEGRMEDIAQLRHIFGDSIRGIHISRLEHWLQNYHEASYEFQVSCKQLNIMVF